MGELVIVATSDEQRALFELETVASQLPIVFANSAEISELECQCASCNENLPEDQVRGRISWVTPKTATLSAVGNCHDCNIVTPFEYRFHDDMRVTALRNGQWVQGKFESGFVDTVLNALKRLRP